jgi:CheY-like chemotaxis protein
MSEKKPLIMVADDEEDIKAVLEMFLEVAGYDVITAYDGLDAIEKIHESKPDLVLMDIMMPLIDGIEVVRQMKADDSIKHIPVIMLTAASKSDMVEKAMQAGAVDYIQKPFEPEQVQNVIQKTLMA